MLLVGLLGGSIADLVDRRRLTCVIIVALAGVSAVFTVQAFAGFGRLWMLYLLAGAQATLQAISGPAQRTFVPRLLPSHQLRAGIALQTLAGRAVNLAGPALAGIVAGAGGLRACYAIDTASFAAALYATIRLPPMRPETGTSRRGGRQTVRDIAEGLRFIRRNRVIAVAFLTDVDAMLLGMPSALFPALNAAHFGGRPETLGLLKAAVGAGGLLSAALAGPASRLSWQGRGMLAGTMIWGAAIAGFGLVRSLPVALGLLAIAGGADTLTVNFRTSMVQTLTPDAFRARVSSVEYIIGTGGAPLGNVEAGAVAALTSPAVSAVSGGVACFAVAVAIAVAFPAFVRYRSEESVHHVGDVAGVVDHGDHSPLVERGTGVGDAQADPIAGSQ